MVVALPVIDSIGATSIVKLGATGAVGLKPAIPYVWSTANMLLPDDLMPWLFDIMRSLVVLLCLGDAVQVLLLGCA